jgi:hypothetical protein
MNRRFFIPQIQPIIIAKNGGVVWEITISSFPENISLKKTLDEKVIKLINLPSFLSLGKFVEIR